MVIDKKENGEMLLFNSVSTSFGIVKPEFIEFYNNFDSIDDESIEELSEENGEFVKTLIDNKFLVDYDIDEKKSLKISEYIFRYATKKTDVVLTIAPTSDCNMRCPYCYEKKGAKRMDEETRKELVKFVDNMTENATGLRVAWYGGEPLLELDTIRELSKEFLDISTKKNLAYRASIITNGILMTREVAQILVSECNVQSAQITLDGIGEIHNKRRLLIDATKDSFEIITNNIDQIIGLMGVNLRINIDRENSQYIDDILKFIIDKNWASQKGISFYFAPVHNLEEAVHYGRQKCYNWKEFGELESYVLRKMNEYNVYDALRTFYPSTMPLSCGALTPMYFVIGPEGEFYKCWNYVGNKSHTIGSLKEGIKANEEFTTWLLLDTPEQCSNCKSLPLCKGGCPQERLTNGNTPACSHRKVSNMQKFKLIYDNYKKGIKPMERSNESCAV